MGKGFERGSVFSDDLKKPARKGPPASGRSHQKKADDLDDLFGADDPDVPKGKRGGRMKITPW